MDKIHFQKAEMRHLEEVFQIFQEATAEMERNQIFQWDEIYPDREILREDIQKQQLFIGWIEEDMAVVYVVNQECDKDYQKGNWKYPNASFAAIHRLCVSPKFQNRGIAQKTVSHIEKEAANQGLESIRLDAFSMNHYALKLYKRLGYWQTGTVIWRKGTFYLMEKKLLLSEGE